VDCLPLPPEAAVAEQCWSASPDGELFDPLEGFPAFEIEVGPSFGRADEREARRDLLGLEKRGVTSQAKQGELWRHGRHFKDTVVAKLKSIGRFDLIEELAVCHTEEVILECTGCKRRNRFWNRCDLFYCPACQPRLAAERGRSVEWWTKQISQPKHVVLTVTNQRVFDKAFVKAFLKAFAALRRRVFAKDWRGGFFRLEVTNEGRGWHLHLHALIDARFISQRELSAQWHSVTQGCGHIVRVKDARDQDYLREVTKYAVKGSQLAKWHPEEIATFIDAFKGIRTFGCFGQLYKLRAVHREHMDGVAKERATCPCGCTTVRARSAAELEWLELKVGCPVKRGALPCPTPKQLDLGMLVQDARRMFA
jgi:hypothetical protein